MSVAIDDIACQCAAQQRDAEISIVRRKAMDLDIFLREENIMRYRRLLDLAMGSVE